MSLIKRLFSPANIKQQTAREYNELFFRNVMHSLGIPDTTDKTTLIKDGYQSNATVYSIVNYILSAASIVTPKVYKITDREAMKEYKSLISGAGNDLSMTKAALVRDRGLKPAPDSDLARVIDNPNPDMGYTQWISELLGFKLLTGDGYIQGVSPSTGSNAGKIMQLYILPSHLTEIMLSDSMSNPISGYKLKFFNSRKEIDYKDVAHIKSFNPDYNINGSHLYGQSPLTAAYRNLKINNDAITTGNKYLENQGARGMLASDDMGMLTQEQAEALKDRYREKYQGSANAADIIITNHMFKWIDMGLPAADLALIEQYNLSKKDIAAAYNFPSLLLNDTAEFSVSTYREAKKQLYLQKIIPELSLLRDELNRWLTPTHGKEYYIDFDYMSIPELQEDMEKVVKQLNVSWWFTPNEKRVAMKADPLDKDGMDDIYVPANLINLSIEGTQGDLLGGNPMQRLSDTIDYIQEKQH